MTPTLRGALASAGFVAVLVGAAHPMNADQGTTALALPQQPHAHAAPPDATAGGPAAAQRRHAMMARLATMDARIEMLTAQMKSFTGDMKVEAMASVVTALVERQQMVRDEIAQMRGRMTRQRTAGATSSHVPSEVDLDTLCLPEAVSPQR